MIKSDFERTLKELLFRIKKSRKTVRDGIHVFFFKKPVKGHSTESFLILL